MKHAVPQISWHDFFFQGVIGVQVRHWYLNDPRRCAKPEIAWRAWRSLVAYHARFLPRLLHARIRALFS